MLIVGDSNLSETLWLNTSDFSGALFAYCYSDNANTRVNSEVIMNTYSLLGLKQYYPVHQKNGYTLDLAFSTLSEHDIKLMSSIDSVVPVEVDHHDPAYLSVNCSVLNSL